MRILVVCCLASCLLLGCSGERADTLDGTDDATRSTTEGSGVGDEQMPADPGTKPALATAQRQVSLEAAGGEASSTSYRMRFRVAAPIVVAGARPVLAAPKGATP